jgi:hypothetical protein
MHKCQPLLHDGARAAGLFDWSMKYQDGTRPSDWDPSQYDPQKMKWWVGTRLPCTCHDQCTRASHHLPLRSPSSLAHANAHIAHRRLEGVLKHYMQDFAARMQQIKMALDTGVAPPPAPDGPDGDQPSDAQSQPPGQNQVSHMHHVACAGTEYACGIHFICSLSLPAVLEWLLSRYVCGMRCAEADAG